MIAHVNKNKWTSLEHFIVNANSGKTNPMTQYSVQGVPHVMLVDKSGTVVFKGHPSLRNLKTDIDSLL